MRRNWKFNQKKIKRNLQKTYKILYEEIKRKGEGKLLTR